MPLDPAQLDELFSAALAESDAKARAGLLDRACNDNVELRERLAALLAAHDAAGSFLQLPSDDATVQYVALSERPGSTIGRYKLLEQLGEGGFGVVFMAEQEQPVRRRVALKVIKLGMDTKQVVARFEAERQALAMMDHPNIAKVFDAGSTDTGRPYFVMELIRGVPITKYCNTETLGIADRLLLFILVCQAVQHAHQKGIIHRDLKPSNVLVAMHDDQAVPKVIDFGVAKTMEGKLTDHTLFTGFHQLLGTPIYMSPEQAKFSSLDVDTRSDIYSLGVLLYELMTGTTPFDRKQFLTASLVELQRIVCEVEPLSPSARIGTLAADIRVTHANERNTDPRRLAQSLRGDLDWIVMRCLEKDRKRRYPTANSLALDVQRFLDSQPVEARPPSNVDRVQKFAHRNKLPLSIAGLVLIFLFLLGGGAGWAIRDRAARRSALSQNANRLLDESALWQQQGRWPEALTAVERANTLISSSSADAVVIDRVKSRLADINLLAKLDDIRGLCESGEELADFTRGEADDAYLRSFQEFGIDVNALDVEKAADLISARSVPIELAAALDHWALVRNWQNRHREAKRLFKIASEVDPDVWRNRLRDALQNIDSGTEQLLELAVDSPSQKLLPATLVLLGTALESSDRREQAFAFLSQAQRRFPNDYWINWRLASCALLLDRWEDAIRFYSVALALRPGRPDVYARLGGALGNNKRLDEGIAEIKEAIRIKPNYPRAYSSITWLLATYPDPDQRRPAEAVKFAKKALKLQPQHPNSWANAGVAHYAAGDWKAAAELLEQANRMLNGEDYAHRFYLAMARLRIDDTHGAREAYDQGVHWMNLKHQPHQEILLRAQAEAERLFGISNLKPKIESNGGESLIVRP